MSILPSGEEEGNEQENLSSMDDKDTKTFDKDSKEGIKGQLRKKTKVKSTQKGNLSLGHKLKQCFRLPNVLRQVQNSKKR